MGWIKTMIKNYLDIKESENGMTIDIDQLFNFESNVFRNKIWYRGEPNELEALYKQLNDTLGNKHFWGSKPTVGMNIRKIHTGLPSLIVDTLTDIVVDDLSAIKLSERQEEWDEMASEEENNFKDIIKTAVLDILYLGDGAFKISVDESVSKYPILEFFGADRVDFEYNRGRIIAVIFKTKKTINKKEYTLKERYSKRGIEYKLYNKEEKEMDIREFEALKDYHEDVINKAEFMMAIPLRFRNSIKYSGRGKSLFEGKTDDFDAFDEVFSQWMLAVRKGQIKEYIPEMYLPRNPKTGAVMKSNDMDNSFVSIESDMTENGKNEIRTTQGNIQYEALQSTYVTALDLCLQGIISPSTLGIDVKKLDNAEAQREKEKVTLYRRNQIVDSLIKIIPKVVKAMLQTYDNMKEDVYKEIEITASFGGYANPSFEAQVETVGKAATNNTMSIETQVEELWGDDKDEEWKNAEVARIKAEKGVFEALEPSVNQDNLNNEIINEELENIE